MPDRFFRVLGFKTDVNSIGLREALNAHLDKSVRFVDIRPVDAAPAEVEVDSDDEEQKKPSVPALVIARLHNDSQISASQAVEKINSGDLEILGVKLTAEALSADEEKAEIDTTLQSFQNARGRGRGRGRGKGGRGGRGVKRQRRG